MQMTTQLPTGTVTFLFTDIEASTRLLRELGEAYAGLLQEHRDIVRSELEREGGAELGTEGDSFFAVFRSPAAATRAVIAMQRALADHTWPEGTNVRVRMGLHTGEGTPIGDGYVGLDVHRASRIGDAGHGGQILISEATAALIERTLPDGAELVDLGEHRLKDLPQAERLFQLSVNGLSADFPPLRSLDARPNNLPAQLTRFIGRHELIGDAEEALEGARFLTFTGPGGTGKTRLALEVAHRSLPSFADGAWFVDLSAVGDPSVVSDEIASVLGVTLEPGRPVFERLEHYLEDKELLLVLDNFEQVVAAAGGVEHLLSHAPRLKVLVTSRSVLSVYGEREFPVPPLRLPDPECLPDELEVLSESEAVSLFVDRARATRPDFQLTKENAAAVAEICARLDGLPLAIELAAVRVKVLTPQDILPRLGQSLSLLTSGPRSLPPRQRTLRGAIDWSYRLLDEPRRRLFARMSAFVGGATLESVEAVCAPDLGYEDGELLDLLGALVDDSLLRRTETVDGQVRFHLLHTIREFAEERLEEEPDADDVRKRFAELFLDLANRAEPHLVGEDQRAWLDRIELEQDNLRSALKWSIDLGFPEAGMVAAGGVWRFWQQRGHLAEGRKKLDALLRAPGGEARTAARAKALNAAGGLAYWQNDWPATERYYTEAADIAQELGDDRLIAEGLYNLSYVDRLNDNEPEGMEKVRRALAIARRIGDKSLIADCLGLLASAARREGRVDDALAMAEESLALVRETGNRYALADSLAGMGEVYRVVGDGDAACRAHCQALTIFSEVGNPTGITLTLEEMAMVDTMDGRYERALRLGGAAAALKERIGGGPPAPLMRMTEAYETARRGLDPDTAERAWGEGLQMDTDKAVAYALDSSAELLG
jgi:predicted ATPase/class 3 adenylate cyclase